MVGRDGSILRANNSFARMLGYSVEELKTRTFRDLTHPDDLATNLSVLNKTLVGEADSYSIEKRYVRKDGGVVWASLTVGCVRTTDGGVDYFVSVVQDITDRKQAEARLAERNATTRSRRKVSPGLGPSRTIMLPKNCSCHRVVRSFMGCCPRARSRSHASIGARWCIRTICRGWTPSLQHAFSNGETEFVLEFRIFRHGEVRWIESRVLISYNELRTAGAKDRR